ncbi:hypothetical protein GQF02_02515 [Neisseriaceae bacterium B2N2-7]|uniref:KfrA N-terminal DNA-binding domain-containing protein n=2 Tax=Craterilacuibacter sinensis TaxID=2686017 RepID=A0A845BGI1_9NEIS|nr:hypothetical protein [Craterilacuibacter sinensis]
MFNMIWRYPMKKIPLTLETVLDACALFETQSRQLSVRAMRDHLGGSAQETITEGLRVWKKKKESEQSLIELDESVLKTLIAWAQGQRTRAAVELRLEVTELQRRLLEADEMSSLWSAEVEILGNERDLLRQQVASLSAIALERKEQLLRLEAQHDALVDQVGDLRRQLRMKKDVGS